MPLRKKKLLAAFLEKDNLKLLVYEVGRVQASAKRIFAGQITFDSEVMRDAFVADARKFCSQVKVAFAQKPVLRDVAEAVLFLPPDKTFTKTMSVEDSVDGFVQSLPYFREELILTTEELKESRVREKEIKKVTHIAFEKKLVEDLQRPFLESGKTILAVRSVVSNLVAGFPKEGDYFLLCPFEKEIAFAFARDGAISEASGFKTDLFVTRFGEYVAGHSLEKVKAGYYVGIFPAELAEKVRHANGLDLVSLARGDIYDLAVVAYLRRSRKGLMGFLGELDFSKIRRKLPGQRKLFLVGAAVVSFVLAVALVKNGDRLRIGGQKSVEVVSPVGTQPAKPVPEPKPGDYSVRILNGTLVTGEAGRLAEKIKNLGFEVTEAKNATSAGFVGTRLRVVPNTPDSIILKLDSALRETYDAVVVEPMTDSGVKIEIIIGKKKP